jgi:hypothetical protein
MPWFEHQPCRFCVTDDGLGNPSILHMEFWGGKSTLLPHKQIASVYLGLRAGVDREKAEAVVAKLNRVVGTLSIRHLAAGE